MKKKVLTIMIWGVAFLILILIALEQGLFNEMIELEVGNKEVSIEQNSASNENKDLNLVSELYPYKIYNSSSIFSIDEKIAQSQVHREQEEVIDFNSYNALSEGKNQIKYRVINTTVSKTIDKAIDPYYIESIYGDYLDEDKTLTSKFQYVRVELEITRLSENINEILFVENACYSIGNMGWIELIGDEYQTKGWGNYKLDNQKYLITDTVGCYEIDNKEHIKKGELLALRQNETCHLYMFFVVPQEVIENNSMCISLNFINNVTSNHLDKIQFIQLDLEQGEW